MRLHNINDTNERKLIVLPTPMHILHTNMDIGMAPGQGSPSLIECPGLSILLVIYLSVNLVLLKYSSNLLTYYLQLWHLHIPIVVYSTHLLFAEKKQTS